MATVVGAPPLDRSLQMALMGFAQPFAQGLVARGQNRALQGFAEQLGLNLPSNIPPQLAQMLIGQQFDPYGQKAAIAASTLAGTEFMQGPQTEHLEALSKRAGIFSMGPGGQLVNIGGERIGEQVPFAPTVTDPFTLGPGQRRFGPSGRPITETQPFVPEKLERGVRQIYEDPPGSGEFKAAIVDPTTGETIRELGKPTPREIMGEVAPEAMSPSTKGKYETEIKETDRKIAGLESVRNLYDPSYSTYVGKLRKFITAKREKAMGLPIIGELLEPTKMERNYLARYSKWFGRAESEYLTFRKWATGVAGGPQEMAQIRMAFPDPKDKSPTEFKAMLDEAIEFEKEYKRELIRQIQAGTVIDRNIKRGILMDTLNKMPASAVIPTDIRTMSDEELKRIAGIE